MALIQDVIYDPVLGTLPDLSGMCVAITGCTTGTGFWTAIAAVRKGAACIVLLNRASARALEAEDKVKGYGGTKVVTVDCDLQSFASVRGAAKQLSSVAAEYGGLDVLINNAGVMAVPDERTVDGYDVQMQTNHLSHFLLTKLMMPSLELAASTRGEARVVQHSSGARGGGPLEAQFFGTAEPGSLGGDAIPSCFNRYHQTKLANPVFAMALHDKLVAIGSKIKSVCAEPGVSATNLLVNLTSAHQAVRPETELPTFNFKPQSAADGACPLMLAAFAEGVNSGDFYMPGDVVEDKAVGMPVKCMTVGQPTPTNQYMVKRFNNEEQTMSEANRRLLWLESSRATEKFVVGRASKI